MYRLEYLPVLKQDLEQIVRCRSQETVNQEAASKLCWSIIEAAEHLKKFPYIGMELYPDGTLKRTYRVLLIKKYMLFFSIDEEGKTVTVARVISGWRKYDKLLKYHLKI